MGLYAETKSPLIESTHLQLPVRDSCERRRMRGSPVLRSTIHAGFQDCLSMY